MYRRVVDGYGEYDYATFNDNFQQQNGTVLAYWQNEVDKYYVINDRCTTSPDTGSNDSFWDHVCAFGSPSSLPISSSS